MLLTRVEITDFLSVKGTLPIDLDKKITILLGSNDHGKSNILRAIQHLNDDEPITEQEANWDATDSDDWNSGTSPAISFVFSLTAAERKEWKPLVEQVVHQAAEALLQADNEGDEKSDGEDEADENEETEPPATTITRSSIFAATKVAPGESAKKIAPARAPDEEE
jgi:predicted ATP-dependent endonuclease of OLD family